MKRCPKCRRDYYDDSLLYCLDDGAELVQGSVPPPNEPATATLPTLNYDRYHAEPAVANSIAVLPFVNMSADEENEYFCDGLAEEILNALAHIDKLKVAARTSAFSFKGRHAPVSEIAAALNVSTVLEGSVRKSRDRVRITAQLINAADGYHLWSERYDRDLKDIFDVQDEIAIAVVDALKIKLLGKYKAALLKRHTESAEAHEHYLRGLSHFNKWTPGDFNKSIENFQKAIAIDPNYASVYAAMADAYTELSFFSFSAVDAGPKAREAAGKALQLDDGLAEAHNSLALIRMYFDWDYAGAEAAFKSAIDINPGNASVHMWYGWFLGLMTRFDESLVELNRGRELDPLSAPNANAIGVVLYWSGQNDKAIAQFENVLELHPNYPVTIAFLAEAYLHKGDLPSTIATIEKIASDAMDPQALSVMGYVYARAGDNDGAFEILNKFKELSGRGYAPAINFAHIYAGLGDHENAFRCLRQACEERVTWVPFMRVDPKFDVLRSDRRFDDLLRNAGFPM